jgi:ubiquinone/menaquinone biosynthesis C-methylase UbiE
MDLLIYSPLITVLTQNLWLMAPSPEGTEYYNSIKSKWATDYPSSETIDEVWSFYEECGYENPQATLQSMIDPIPFTKKRILDYGCDKGLMLDFFCNSTQSDVEGHGLDINDEAIKLARTKYPDYQFKVCDGLSIDYPDKYFDLIFVIATIKHVRYEDREAVYAEINRVADHVLFIEADEKEQHIQSMMGWSFYNSNFAKEFEDNFGKRVKIVREAGDILGLYTCK